MARAPNANWTTARQAAMQAPVYYIAIDGLATVEYSTGPVKSAAVTKKAYMEVPSGLGGSVDPLDGAMTVGEVRVELLDIGDEITDLVATEASGAPVSTLVNRKVTLYGGYRELAESDYASLYVGRIRGIQRNRDGTGYVFTLADSLHQLAGEIMTNATEDEPTTLRGNPVNLWMSILRGVFSTSDADFPLDFVSTAVGGTSSAPTGLGLADATFDFTQIKARRDVWRATDVVEVEFEEPEDALQHLEEEFHRAFQARPVLRGDGTIGLEFNTPPLPATAAITLDEDSIVRVRGWTQTIDNHLNKFVIRGDYDFATDTYTDLYTTETTEDTTNQTNTGETVEYKVESRWLRTAYSGVAIADELAGRARLTYLNPPVIVQVELLFSRLDLEPGDTVAVTLSDVPDLRTGTLGLTERIMVVLSLRTDFGAGRIIASLLDIGYRRYGVIAPTGTADYGSASDSEKAQYAYIGATGTNLLGGTDPGFRLI